MMKLSISKSFRTFRRREDGSVVVEAVMILPLMFWTVSALFTYWDTYRSINMVQKATYTISDAISREDGAINTTYLNGMRSVMNYLLDPGQTTKMRVTSLTWSQARNRYEVIWSCSALNQMSKLSTGDLNATSVKSRLPVMPDGETVVLVQTEVNYSPLFNVGYGDRKLQQFVVTRPRAQQSIPFPTCTAS